MAMNIGSAITAYQNAARQVFDGQPAAMPEAPKAGGSAFGDLVRQGLEEARNVQRHSEEMSLKGIAGEADMRDVVLAVSNAEQALSTVVAVRDKVVSAYQEILRMPI